MPQDSAMLEPIIAGYSDLRFTAQGSSGWLFAARNSETQALAAVKVFKKELLSTNEASQRFQREIKALSQVSHPNIVKILGCGNTASGASYIATEFISGVSISTLLETEGVVDSKRASVIAIDVCKALIALHAAKIIHRDIKPSNIMIDEHQNVKVIDFGIAKFLESSNDTITQYGGVIGTPAYMSPEQCLGQTVDERSDVYSLGCTLFEMVVGKKAFEAGTAMQSLAKQIDADRSAIERDLRSTGIAKDLQAIIATCLNREPANRYENSAELETNLNDFLAGRPLTYSKRSSNATAATAATSAPGQYGQSNQLAPGKVMWHVAVRLILLMCLGFGALYYFAKKDSLAPNPTPSAISIPNIGFDKTEFSHELSHGLLNAGQDDLVYLTTRPTGKHFVTVAERLRLEDETALPITRIPEGERHSFIVGRSSAEDSARYSQQRESTGWDGWQIRLDRSLADEWSSKVPGKLQSQIRVRPDGRIDRVEIVACVPAVGNNGHFLSGQQMPDLKSFEDSVEQAIERVSASRVLAFPATSTAKGVEVSVTFNLDKDLNHFITDLRTMSDVPLQEEALWRARICSILDGSGLTKVANHLRARLPEISRHTFTKVRTYKNWEQKSGDLRSYWLRPEAQEYLITVLEHDLSDGRYHDAEVVTKRICMAKYFSLVLHEPNFVPQLYIKYDALNENYVRKLQFEAESKPNEWGLSEAE